MISLIRESASVIWTSTNMFESFKNKLKKNKKWLHHLYD